MRGNPRARETVASVTHDAAMDPKFAALIETLAPKLARLLAMQPLAYGALPGTCPEARW